jgi:sugar diacid utilization regulator
MRSLGGGGVVVGLAHHHLLEPLVNSSGSHGERSLALQSLRLASNRPVRLVAVRVDDEHDAVIQAGALASGLRPSAAVRIAPVGRIAAVLIQSDDPTWSPLALIRETLHHAAVRNPWRAGLRVGVGVSADCTNSHESWESALVATRFARPAPDTCAIDPCDAAIGYEELCGLELLADLPPDRLRRHRDVAAVESMLESSSGALDVKALEAFSRTGSLRQAAQSLYLHHSTVAVRLARVEAATGWDLNDPDDRFRARFALWARRLTLAASES